MVIVNYYCGIIGVKFYIIFIVRMIVFKVVVFKMGVVFVNIGIIVVVV